MGGCQILLSDVINLYAQIILNFNGFSPSFSSLLLLYLFPPSQVPLSLSRTFVVSRAESLAGSPGTVAFSVFARSLFTSKKH